MGEVRWQRVAGLRATLACGLAFIPGAVAHAAAFDRLNVHLERNVAEGDSEMVFQAAVEDCGIASLEVTGPDGSLVLAYREPADGRAGVGELRIESAELAIDRAGQRYPAGRYAARASTTCGKALAGSVELSGSWPPTPRWIVPADRSAVSGGAPVTLQWTTVPGATAYRIDVEGGPKGEITTIWVPGSSTTITLPASLFAAGRKYELSIGAFDASGNGSFVETVLDVTSR